MHMAAGNITYATQFGHCATSCAGEMPLRAPSETHPAGRTRGRPTLRAPSETSATPGPEHAAAANATVTQRFFPKPGCIEIPFGETGRRSADHGCRAGVLATDRSGRPSAQEAAEGTGAAGKPRPLPVAGTDVRVLPVKPGGTRYHVGIRSQERRPEVVALRVTADGAPIGRRRDSAVAPGETVLRRVAPPQGGKTAAMLVRAGPDSAVAPRRTLTASWPRIGAVSGEA